MRSIATVTNLKKQPKALLDAVERVKRVLDRDSISEIDKLLNDTTVDEAWRKCDEEMRDRRSGVLPRAFFASLLLILVRKEFPKEGTGAVMRRRKAIAKTLRGLQKSIASEESVGSLDVTRFFTFPDDIQALPGLIPNDVRRACVHACWLQHPSLSVSDLLTKLIEETERPLPADRIQWGRKTIRRQIMEEKLAGLFSEFLDPSSNYREMITDLTNAVLSTSSDRQDLGARQRARRRTKQ